MSKMKIPQHGENESLVSPVEQFAPGFFALVAARLSERIVEEGAEIAAASGIVTPARCMSTIVALTSGPKGVSELGRMMGVSHVAAMKNVRSLSELGFVQTGIDPSDARRKPIHLSNAGRTEAAQVIEFVQALQAVFREVDREIGESAYDSLLRFEEALDRQSLSSRISI
ncbi:MarR family winged helix-turn-helix transcriptional regulator [Altererythrobacter sp. MF3-039]|uniref:MarR family winged helix-turn-helix transcriptional regulator n=1 Tax=Altererythrobacter sp. MF3-039 TaxID=3252901 RepID=UPI00390C45EA